MHAPNCLEFRILALDETGRPRKFRLNLLGFGSHRYFAAISIGRTQVLEFLGSKLMAAPLFHLFLLGPVYKHAQAMLRRTLCISVWCLNRLTLVARNCLAFII